MSLLARILIIFTTFSYSLAGRIAQADEWNVGFNTLQVSDPELDYDIDVAVWYPTQESAKAETVGPATLYVARGAKPIARTHGLILISHGFSGSFLGHNDTAQFLARQGFVVATPTHPDLPGLKSGKPAFDPLVVRPRHLRLVSNRLLNHPQFKAGFLQPRVGVIGYSLGGYTALAASGVQPDLSGLAAYCSVEINDALLCSPEATQRFATIADQLPQQKIDQLAAIVLLAPAYGPLFSEQSLAKLDIPVRLFSAEKDQELDNRYNAQHFEKFLGNTSANEVIKDAGHFVFMAPCPDALKHAIPLLCEDNKNVDRLSVHQKLNETIGHFFARVFGQQKTDA
ncbi:alpha/beta hydrolase family protein [Amphritea sp.]|uniref:alpha/beta hydrolase family protein n=1 Tax=Amphritea sp. TaxID=1872502 RepID=UPI003D0DA94E